ncbi:MAG: hypothetical protein Q8O99_06335 [bacterium]|nr:hypothetical protein [bacterium]
MRFAAFQDILRYTMVLATNSETLFSEGITKSLTHKGSETSFKLAFLLLGKWLIVLKSDPKLISNHTSQSQRYVTVAGSDN